MAPASFIFVVVVQTISTVVQIKEKENTKAVTKKNILAEEDEVDFQSCCGAETIEFVIPPKYFKLNIIFHGLISGGMCGLTLWLALLVVVSIGVFLGAYFIPACFGTVVLSAAMGYLLSTDLGSLGSQALQVCRTNNKVSTSQFLQDSASFRHNTGFLWSWPGRVQTHALLEMSVVHVILITMSSNSTIQTLGAPTLLLITGLARDRVYQLSNKLYFFLALLLSSWRDKKQRRASTAPTLLLSLISSPPQRFWPEAVGASANSCADTVYYRQLAPMLARALKTGFASGSPGEPQVKIKEGEEEKKKKQKLQRDEILWSDDDLDKPKPKKKSLKQAKVAHSATQSVNPTVTSVTPKLNPHKEKSDLDDMLDELDFGLPAADINRPNPAPGSRTGFGPNPLHASSRVNGNHIYKPVTNLAGSPDFKCQYSSHMSLPSKWRELPIEHSQLARHMASFPVDWYRHVLAQLDWSATGLPGEKVAIDVDKELYGARYQGFQVWVQADVGFCLAGGIDDHEELEESLREFDSSWYIGLESDPEWKLAVLDNTIQPIFSLGHNNLQFVKILEYLGHT
nr:hypothetical protein BaRGS_007025 [Batillaria attramentaria]